MSLASVLSITVLAFLGWAVPVALMRAMPDSLRGLLAAIVVAVPVLTLAGSGFFVWLYGRSMGLAVIGSAPAADAALHFWSLGVRAGLIWGPILAITALALAHGIERRRGERLASRDRN